MVTWLWILPLLPLLAAAIIAVAPAGARRFAAGASILAMAAAAVLSLCALGMAIEKEEVAFYNFNWLQIGDHWVQLGWLLDPLSAVMLVTVASISLLIFIYSAGYMAHDENFTRFFCFLSLFAAGMLGLLVANSLLLLFICWEIVGLTSYLLIGFWFHKPAAAAAAKKAFITTRIGDLGLLAGMLWLYAKTGTLVFYDHGGGCLETAAVNGLLHSVVPGGFVAATAIGLLIFSGAVGKSGQVPLHVWLPDAMEGPTPVSALIHAATMVAAGVFLVARVYPLLAAHEPWRPAETTCLQVIGWTGTVTALMAALIAAAQTDIKRILAYSTVSQLGFMMLGIATGGPQVGMFHLVTHAFFKALLFLGAGSVIHGLHEEQDIRNMGGLWRRMPVTFVTYAVGMLALSGFPLLFSGFWSKEAILHSAAAWKPSLWPFYLGLSAAFLTAFYMTRQVCLVFFHDRKIAGEVHESPRVMSLPLLLLAALTVGLVFVATPAWPWLEDFIGGETAHLETAQLLAPGFLKMLLVSSVIVLAGLAAGGLLYGRRVLNPGEPDPLQKLWPNVFELLRRKMFVDEIYSHTVVAGTGRLVRACHAVERWGIDLAVRATGLLVIGFSWISQAVDQFVLRSGFDRSCAGLRHEGARIALFQNGQTQRYLKLLVAGVALIGLLLIWGCER